jgi:hypothetical protein
VKAYGIFTGRCGPDWQKDRKLVAVLLDQSEAYSIAGVMSENSYNHYYECEEISAKTAMDWLLGEE